MNFIKKHSTLILSTLVPTIIMLGYFIYRQFAPFGSSSLLTVDMGQQYVAFYEYFRQTILGHPGQLFYTFANGLGSDMFGTWSYYLFSPTNLVLLFFKQSQITSGILVVTLLKYALSGLTMAIYLNSMSTKSKNNLPNVIVIALATAYSLMAFAIANQLNLFWLDALVLLPLIILGLDRLINNNKIALFVSTMSLMVIINYYFAYMIALFGLMYFLWKLPRYTFKKIFLFIKSWIFVLCCSAITWMPTLWALLHGKAKYTEEAIQWKFEYNPLKIFTKYWPGTFSFKQMSDGLPNIYVGMFVLIAFIAFFFCKEIKLTKRIGALLITGIILLSFFFSPLDLLWHAMQFPWWYPYRFSFIFSFWMIILGYEALQHPSKNKLWLPIITSLIIFGTMIFSTFKFEKSIKNFFDSNQLQFGIILFIAGLIFWLTLQQRKIHWQVNLIVSIFIVLDVSASLAWSLNRISYVSQSEFQNYTVAAQKALKQIKSNNGNDFTRVGTNYFRTKNDPIQLGYNSGSSFNSNLETNLLETMTNLGQPTTSGNVVYMNGTLVSDALLNFKYWSFVDAKPKNSPFSTKSVRFDALNRYQYLEKTKYADTYRNAFAIPLIFTSENRLKNNLSSDPTTYQEQIFKETTGNKQDLFSDITNQAELKFTNTNQATFIKGAVLNKQNLSKDASVNLSLTPTNNNPIYLTVGNGLNHENAEISVNGSRITEDIDYEHPIVLSVGDQAQGRTLNIQIKFKKSNLYMEDFKISQLNFDNFYNDSKILKNNAITNLKVNSNKITGQIQIDNNRPYLFTSIPYSPGWHLKVDGHSVTTKKVAKHLLGSSVKLTDGKHSIKLVYIPPYFILGLSITVGFLLLCGIAILLKKHK